MNYKVYFTALLFVVPCFTMQPQDAVANNIAVTNVSLGLLYPVANYAHVKFDLAWDNSWRTSTYESNWDAAWVFVKYCLDGSNWNHAALATSGHYAPAGSVIDTSSDGKGVFIYRSIDGIGNVSYPGVRLRWNYTGTGLETNENVDIAVFAIEMVYVPEGSFELGSGGTETSPFYKWPTSTDPYPVTNEDAITVGTATGNLYYAFSTYAGDQLGPVSNAFPKGFQAFYCMKYEISQGQYADFLNKLTYDQAANRYPNQTLNRHTISGSYTNYHATRPDRACNYLSWADGAAYADWACLRPMTELEFEKACRGTNSPVANEYAWGTDTIIADPITLAITNATDGSENGTEYVINDVSLGACCYGDNAHSGGDGGSGPLRCGIFAGYPTNAMTRVLAGATYYGVMEMSGNVWERPVIVGKPKGRSFMGTHGDGSLAVNGDHTNSDWPAAADALGAGFRGGVWFEGAGCERVSDRIYAASTYALRYEKGGWRGVRTAP